MKLRALWTHEAGDGFMEIMDHLDDTWGTLVANAFASDVAQTVALLEVFPNAGVLEVPDLGIRSIPVARQVRVFYRFDHETLFVLEFIDTRSSTYQRLKG
ncbi:MAG TPA: type II toxin-antitoxin system RelE/ParE family toxin [Flavobacteriales bacterium]|nr:type II toxin-antitoxin system RelE/ParE family toxin [Flavobacteriales bacterium]